MPRQLELDQKSRPELVEEARRHGVERPERMTRVELADEILRLTTAPEDQADARGLFGVARSMLASVVESGLNLPDAASVIRGGVTAQIPVRNQTPVATVTLAEIYAAQGHRKRALSMLEEVLAEEPDHEEARRVLNELQGEEPEPSAEEASGFVDTEGEEIRTGKPPGVDELPLVEATEASSRDSGDFASGTAVDELPPNSTPAEEFEEHVPCVAAKTRAEVDEHHSPVATEIESTVLVTRRAGGSLLLYWELSPSSLERCALDLPEGAPSIRIVAITPSGARPTRVETTFALREGEVLSETTGRSSLGGFAENAVIVTALAWSQREGFLPLCVGRQLEELQAGAESPDLCARAAPHLNL